MATFVKFEEGTEWDNLISNLVKQHLQDLQLEAQKIESETQLEQIHERLMAQALEKLRNVGMKTNFQQKLTIVYHQVYLETLATKQKAESRYKSLFKTCFDTFKSEMRRVIKEQFICNEERDPSPDLYRISLKMLARYDKTLESNSDENLIISTIKANFRLRLEEKMQKKVISFVEKPVKSVTVRKSVLNYKRICAIGVTIFFCIILTSGAFVYLHAKFMPSSNSNLDGTDDSFSAGNQPTSTKFEIRLTCNSSEEAEKLEILIYRLETMMDTLESKIKDEIKDEIRKIDGILANLQKFRKETQQVERELVPEVMSQLHYFQLLEKRIEGESPEEMKNFHENETQKVIGTKGFEKYKTDLENQLGAAYNRSIDRNNWQTRVNLASLQARKFYEDELSSPKVPKQLLPLEMSSDLHEIASLGAISTYNRVFTPKSPIYLASLKENLDQQFYTKFSSNAIIGIDFGSKYTRAVVYLGGKLRRIPNFERSGDVSFSLPNYVMNDQGNWIVGQEALDFIDLPNFNSFTTLFYDMKGILREFPYGGEDKAPEFLLTFSNPRNGEEIQATRGHNSNAYRIQDVIGRLLQKVRENAERFLGGPVHKCVITVLPDLGQDKLKIIEQAGVLAGFTNLTLLSENLAVGLALQHLKIREGASSRKLFIFQLGARYWGTSILEEYSDGNHYEIQPWTWYDGGFRMLNELVKYCISEFFRGQQTARFEENKFESSSSAPFMKRRLFENCEKAVIELTMRDSTVVKVPKFYNGMDLSVIITRKMFEDSIKGQVEWINRQILEQLSNSRLSVNIIDDVILSGGCGRIPKIQRIIEENFNGKNGSIGVVKRSEDLVAYGAALRGARLAVGGAF